MNTARHTRTALALTLLGTFVAQSAWACKVPTAPKAIPDGRSADMSVMLDAKRNVEQYLEQVFVYMSCENDGVKLQDVVARQKVVMDRFNAEVREFNSGARALEAVHRN